MSRVPQRSILEPVPRRAARARSGAALVALGLVALQLVLALHFALVPHGFSAGSERLRARARRALGAPSGRAHTERFGHPCAARRKCGLHDRLLSHRVRGQHSVLLAHHVATELLTSDTSPEPTRSGSFVVLRKRVLLAAPKTSPPV